MDAGKWVEKQALLAMGHEDSYHGFQKDFRMWLKSEHDIDVTHTTISNIFAHGFNSSMFDKVILSQWAKALGCSRNDILLAHGLMDDDAPIDVDHEIGKSIISTIRYLSQTGQDGLLKKIAGVVEVLTGD